MNGGYFLNAKIERVSKDIEKARGKISEFQTRLRELEKQKNELENLEIVEVVRGMSVSIDELAVLLQTVKNGGALPAPTSGQNVHKSNIDNDKEDLI